MFFSKRPTVSPGRNWDEKPRRTATNPETNLRRARDVKKKKKKKETLKKFRKHVKKFEMLLKAFKNIRDDISGSHATDYRLVFFFRVRVVRRTAGTGWQSVVWQARE